MISGADPGSARLSLLAPAFGTRVAAFATDCRLDPAAQGCELIIGSAGESPGELLGRARGTWVLLADASLTLDTAAVASLCTATERHGRADVIYFDWRFTKTGLLAPDRQRAALTLEPAAELAKGWPSPAAGAMLMRRSTLVDGGGYDGRFRRLATAEAALRLARHGARFRRDPDMVFDLTPLALGDQQTLNQYLAEALDIARQGQQALPAATRNQPHAETSVLFHAIGMAAGAGLDPLLLAGSPPIALPPEYDVWSACSALLDGMARSCRAAGTDEVAGWNGLRARIEPALAALAPRFAWPEFSRSVLGLADRLLAQRCPAGSAVDVGAVGVRTFELAAEPADLDLTAGIERLHGVVTSQGRDAGRFLLAPTGPIPAAEIETILADFRAPPVERPTPPLPAGDTASATEFWEARFSIEDPWDYDGPYEACKARQTLDIIPDGLGNALELACAEGHFTRRLAGRVGRLLATDISATALVRARHRCQDLPSVRFAQLDLLNDPLPQDLDLIVCSEVLYYVEDIDALARLAERIAGALRPGGHLVMTHANLINDRDGPHLPGFRWAHAFGARTIGQVFAQPGCLYLAEEHRSPLYRIQRFCKPAEGERPPAPIYRDIDFDRRLSANAAATIDWAGRLPDPQSWPATGVPVLMYHRIAVDAPPPLARYATAPGRFAEQMQWLAENSYHAISLGELEAAIWDGAVLPERAVGITFDDGYRDNLAEAAPILNDFGHRATVFVPTAHIDGRADWDILHGAAAPLMSWADLERLRAAGVEIASHGQRHRPMTALGAVELADELAGSRAVLLDRLGVATTFLAYPYGDQDEAVQRAALAAGYRLGFSTESRRWRPGDRVFAIPRLEVTGGLTCDEFAALVRSY